MQASTPSTRTGQVLTDSRWFGLYTRAQGAVFAALVGLLAAQPLIFSGLPDGYDAVFHLQRIAMLARAVDAGTLYPRWAADFAYGFGYPLFNYYSPLSYFAAALPSLAGLSPVTAATAIGVLLFVAMSIGVWRWLRAEFGDAPALAAAIAYTLAPYVVFNLYGRGAFAEHLALAVAPFVGLGLFRVSAAPNAKNIALAALATAALILSHNLTALMLAPLVAAYVIVRWRSAPARALPAMLGALALGLALSAFFWAPAALERDMVQTQRLYEPAWADYRNGFLSLSQIFVWPGTVDPSLTRQTGDPNANAALAALSIAGAVCSLLPGRARASGARVLTGLGLAGFGLSTLMMTSVSSPIWDGIGSLRYLQFPWRFFGAQTVCLAILAAAAVRFAVARAGLRQGDASGLVIVLLIGTFCVFSRQVGLIPVSRSVDLSARGIAAYEISTKTIGTTTSGEFLPVTAMARPPEAESPLASGAPAEPGFAARLNRSRLPPGVKILRETYAPERYRLEIEASAPSRLVFNTLYFPGWSATVDGKETAIVPSDPHGLIQVDAPAGAGEIEVSFGFTPVRAASTGVSIAACLVAALLGIGYAASHRGRQAGAVHARWGGALLVPSLAAIALLAAKTAWIDTGPTVFAATRFDGVSVRGAAYDIQAAFGGSLALLAADPISAPADDGTLSVTLFWRARARLAEEYSVSVQLMDARGFPAGQSDNQHPGGIPTTDWRPERYARDGHTLRIMPGAPPGRYAFRARVYPYGKPGQIVPILNAGGSIVGTDALIGSVTLGRPAAPWREADLAPQTRLDAGDDGRALALVGYNSPPEKARPGDAIPLTLFWKSLRALNGDARLSVAFVDRAGAALGVTEVEPVPGYPTSLWQPGDVWRGASRLVVPAYLPSGPYRIRVSGPEIGPVDVGVIEVDAPLRTFDKPGIGQPESIRMPGLGEIVSAALAGRSKPNEAIAIRLVWRAAGSTQTSHKVFVHLVSPSGQLTASHDGEPAGWTRPTTGWVAGEYVVDVHEMTIPAGTASGTYQVRVGLYDAISGARLQTASGADFEFLSQTVEIGP